MRVCQVKVQSLLNKTDIISTELNHVDVITISEKWLSDVILQGDG